MTRRFRTIDAHTAGEPLRIIVEGVAPPPGDTLLAKRRWLQQHDDVARRLLMLEPRGHADMYGCLLTDPVTEDGDLGVLFLHNEGYSTMCGHGIIGLVKVGLERGLFQPSADDTANEVANDAANDVVRIDTPAGRVTAYPHWRRSPDSRVVERVSFENVSSFVLHEQARVDVPGIGVLPVDVAFGGAFYAVVRAEHLGVALEPEQFGHIVELGRAVKRAVQDSLAIGHPSGDPDLGFLYGAILVGPSQNHHSRNVCVFADGEVDRSPTGTGVSARAAIEAARGQLAQGETITIESLIGTTFDVRYERTELVAGSLPAVVPIVTGSAFVTGEHRFELDPEDPLAEGFFLR